MAYVGSFWNSGDTTFAGSLLVCQKDIDHTLLNDRNFRCFFPSSNCKFKFRNDTSPPSGKNSISFILSSTCTDLESEFDKPVNAAPCQPTNFSNPCTNDDHIFKPDERAPDAARMFDQTYVCSNGNPEFRLKKRSIRREVENASARVAQLTKKMNCFREKHNLKNKHCRMRFCTSRFPGKCEKQIAFKDKMFLEGERMRSNRNVQSGVEGILQDTKRSYNFTNVVQDERGACKRKMLIENRIAKNKRLLKTVKDVIHEMSEQESLPQMDLGSIQSIKPQNKIANLANRSEQKVRVIKPMKTGNNCAVTINLQKLVFKKQKLEKFLNDSMHEAVKKYRTNRDTWDRIIKSEQFIEA
ncbi:hypothetical protein K0M31_009648 [Melipona bicolor]|uniref:Uncharacterized protein n=1 Tax=Melipona bicolor TaxID=60889 RepID=A0AA40FP05_9HYME|nr:hypothetical protein K0M31_009648 [Melipona bicolor]